MTPPPKPRAAKRVVRYAAVYVGLPCVAAGILAAVFAVWPERVPADPFVALRDIDRAAADAAVERIVAEWRPESAAFVLEVMPFCIHPGQREQLFAVLRRQTAQPFADFDYDAWYDWLWRQPAPDPVVLSRMRHAFYSGNQFPLGSLDYFAGDPATTIRADEIRWGGVLRDGILPLRRPKMVPAAAADYLADTDLVFGVRVEGIARAYPRRILGAHEMVIDDIGGESVTGVYCPLCETMIAYRSRTADGVTHRFGTSGFLYRSNKLMYDADTLSLWHTMTGKPVVGRLVGTGVRLERYPVVTTRWGEWRARHPDTAVIDLAGLQEAWQNTDFLAPTYPEGFAYKSYFATDKLMFGTPARDDRLKNKAEVYVPTPPGDHPPVAVAVAYLASNPVFHLSVGPDRLLIVTSPGGANRAYRVGDRRFRPAAERDHVADETGMTWAVEEEGLRAAGGERLPRCPGHRVFWFAWYGSHPETTLIR